MSSETKTDGGRRCLVSTVQVSPRPILCVMLTLVNYLLVDR